MSIKVINTRYDGHLFRSRVEARWAVFFNELGWQYEYEKEGYDLGNGVWYLPDFYLPELKTWVEVKGEGTSIEDAKKPILFSRLLGDDTFVVVVSGPPTPNQFRCFMGGEECVSVTLSTYIKAKQWGSPYFGGNWWGADMGAFKEANEARFEHINDDPYAKV